MEKIQKMFAPFEERMRSEGLPQIFINCFATYYQQLVLGSTGLIPEKSINAVPRVPNVETFPDSLKRIGQDALNETAIIKLNGGLGTSMGLEKAKSLLPVKNGLSFLEIIAQQAVEIDVPLVLMNSFVTEQDSLAVLDRFPALKSNLPLSFIQHKELKINRSTLNSVSWPKDPDLEWCPPGHGDIYLAMVTNGTLQKLLDAGYQYAFFSNTDNLGAVVDLSLLGYFVKNQIPFMMEVADRTEMDKKGGHLAKSKKSGRYILRESAQCPDEDEKSFQDIELHKYFNTNNIWVNLKSVQQLMRDRNNQIGLPMIRNKKTVDPRDENSTPVYQLETAMGSAISEFDNAIAIRVPRSRFAPVKKTNDLLAVRSDLYRLTDDYHVVPDKKRTLGSISIDLDDRYYKFVSDLDQRFDEVPSLIDCSHLSISGDVRFEKNVICRGKVVLENKNNQQMVIKEGTVLENKIPNA